MNPMFIAQLPFGMAKDKVIELADLILQEYSQPGHVFHSHLQVKLTKQVYEKLNEGALHAAVRILEKHEFIEETTVKGCYRVLQFGSLSDKLRTDEERSEASHQANIATTKGVKHATITAYIAIAIAAGAFIFSLWQFFH